MKTRRLTNSEIVEKLLEDEKLGAAFADWVSASLAFGSPEKRIDTLVSVFEQRASVFEDAELEIDDSDYWEAG